jgi:hypothetical protein
MRFSSYLVPAALAGLAATAWVTIAASQGAQQGPSRAEQDAVEALARSQGVTDPDAILQLRQRRGNSLAGIEQRGCVSSPKVLGEQWIEIDGYRYGGCLARGVDKNLDAARVLIKAAQATGMYRNNAYGFAAGYNQWLVLGDTAPNWLTVGKGTWKGQPAEIRYEWDYRIPGARLFITRPGGAREITVATDPRDKPTGRTGRFEQPELFGDGPQDNVLLVAWKEKSPGVYGGPADMTPEEVLVLSWLMPAGVIFAGRDAADVLKATRQGRNDILTVPVERLGGATMVATLDAAGRPVRTEIDLKGKKYTAEFGNFLNDRMDMEVLGPHQIKIQVDGQPLAEWELEWHHIGPYLVFPVPTEVAARR